MNAMSATAISSGAIFRATSHAMVSADAKMIRTVFAGHRAMAMSSAAGSAETTTRAAANDGARIARTGDAVSMGNPAANTAEESRGTVRSNQDAPATSAITIAT